MQPITYCCPKCNGSKLKVLFTKVSEEGYRVRRRECKGCDHRWYTMQPQEVNLPNWRIGYIAEGRKIFLYESVGSPG